MNSSKDKRVNWSFQRLDQHSLHIELIKIFKKVFDELSVVVVKEQETSDWKGDRKEEEQNHENISHFVGEVTLKKLLHPLKKKNVNCPTFPS